MDTPQRLRLVSWGLVVLCVLLAVSGLTAMTMRSNAMDRAEAQASQLIRVQKIQTSLLAADAIATNGFLVGGLEPTEQRTAYDDQMAAVGELITEAATAQPADRDALAALNTAVDAYAGGIQQARANNRVGYPVGAQYLRNASSELRRDALPIVANLVSANEDRVQDELDRSTGWVPEVFGLLALAGLLVASAYLARTFHRWVNVGVAVALGLSLLATIFAFSSNSSTSGAIDEVSDGPYTLVTSAAAARIEANNAKANESLTLIARGSGESFEEQWQTSAEEVDRHLDTIASVDVPLGSKQSWAGYAEEHEAIRAKDDNGDWDAAVEQATDPEGEANTQFGTFDSELADYVAEQEAAVTDGLRSPGTTAFVLGVLMAVCGVGAAVAALVGIGQRLKEYR
ncbi:MAG: hypothetical protein ACTH2Q_01025 [Propionibacteriaceae bacterium]